MNHQAVIAAVVAALIGAGVVYLWTMPGRYRIVAIRSPFTEYPYDAALGKMDPNEPSLHETIMLDTVTGRTWKLGMSSTGPSDKIQMEMWSPLPYFDFSAPNNPRGQRGPD